MNEKVVLVVSFVGDFEISERHIADNAVKEAVGDIYFLKALCRNGRFLIKLLSDTG